MQQQITTNALLNKRQKLLVFKYFLYKTLEWWHKESGQSIQQNDFGVVKTMKLLFFTSSIENDDNYYLLDNVFNKFYALPRGHVESDVYSELNNNRASLSPYDINIWNTSINATNNTDDIRTSIIEEMRTEDIADHDIICNKIDSALFSLKEKNNTFILYNDDDLVRISHDWVSWRKNMKEAIKNGKRAKSITIEEIKQDFKTYSFDPMF